MNVNYSATLTMSCFPLGSSKRSIVLMFMIIVIPNARIIAITMPVMIPDQIGIEKNPTQSSAGANLSDFIPFGETCS